MFSTPTCPWCPREKRFLVDKAIMVERIKVACDQKAATETIRKTRQMGVPVIKIGSRWIVGFDRGDIDRALAARGS